MKPEFWEDEKIGRLSDLARLNLLGLVSLADDEGRGRASVAWLHNRLHPYSMNGHGALMEPSLRELEDSGRVVFYEVSGERYYWVVNFLKHQRINRPTPSKLPAPPTQLNEASMSTHPRNGVRIRDQGMEKETETEADQGRGRGAGEGEPVEAVENSAEPPPLGATGFGLKQMPRASASKEEIEERKRRLRGQADVILGEKP